jgi:hypothetical protein
MVTGGLGMRVWRRPVHAEVGDVQADNAGVHVRGRLIGDKLGGTARLHGPEKALREVPVQALSETEFRLTVPALPAGTWHLSVTYGDGDKEARLGRFLDDVADKKNAFVLPAASIDGVTVQPTYLWGNEFSVRVTA